jgi:mannosyltransferase
MLEMRTSTAAADPRALHHRSRSSAWLLGAVGAIIGFIGSWIPSYWGDEAASVMSAERSWSSLGGMLGTIDGVHGLYYALLHVWGGMFGYSELSTRLLSAIAVGFMVAGVVTLVQGFGGSRTAVIAGVVGMVLPRTTYMASEARSSAMGAAAAVWLTVLLMRLIRRRSGALGWIGYALAAAACLYLFLYLGLMLVVHGAYIALLHRRALTSWLLAAGSGLVLAAPIVVIGYLQREQIAFLAHRDYATARNVLVAQWFGHPIPAIIAWVLVAAAAVHLVVAIGRRSDRVQAPVRLTSLGLLWLTLPTAVLLIGNAVISPMYNVRYLSFCTPAAAILIALGAEAIAGRVAARRSLLASLGLVTALAIACMPVYVGQRSPWAKDGGSDWRDAAAYVAAHADTGDAVIFDESSKPSRDPRIMLNLYPTSFTGVDDLALSVPFSERTHLWDAVVPNTQAVADSPGSRSIWAIELGTGNKPPADIAMLQGRGFTVDSSQRINRTTVYHLTKE